MEGGEGEGKERGLLSEERGGGEKGRDGGREKASKSVEKAG